MVRTRISDLSKPDSKRDRTTGWEVPEVVALKYIYVMEITEQLIYIFVTWWDKANIGQVLICKDGMN